MKRRKAEDTEAEYSNVVDDDFNIVKRGVGFSSKLIVVKRLHEHKVSFSLISAYEYTAIVARRPLQSVAPHEEDCYDKCLLNHRRLNGHHCHVFQSNVERLSTPNIFFSHGFTYITIVRVKGAPVVR